MNDNHYWSPGDDTGCPKTTDTIYIRFTLEEAGGGKILAIKIVRKIFGWGLKDSKAFIQGEKDATINRHNLRMLECVLTSFGCFTIVSPPEALATGW